MVGEKYRCNLCDLEEKKCKCDRYCSICYGADNVRLCQDGAYYCRTCREACDYTAQD